MLSPLIVRGRIVLQTWYHSFVIPAVFRFPRSLDRWTDIWSLWLLSKVQRRTTGRTPKLELTLPGTINGSSEMTHSGFCLDRRFKIALDQTISTDMPYGQSLTHRTAITLSLTNGISQFTAWIWNSSQWLYWKQMCALHTGMSVVQMVGGFVRVIATYPSFLGETKVRKYESKTLNKITGETHNQLQIIVRTKNK